MMIYSMLFNSTLILGKLGEGRTSVQPEAEKVCNLRWFGVYTEACWECQVVDCLTTLHTVLDAIYATCVSIFIGSKQKPQSFDVCRSCTYLATFESISLSNLESTSSGDHQRNLTITQVTSLMIVRYYDAPMTFFNNQHWRLFSCSENCNDWNRLHVGLVRVRRTSRSAAQFWACFG